jgi:FkbM family methyltransferase
MLKQSIKNGVRNTFLYKSYGKLELIRTLKQWASHDQQMLDFYSQFINSNDLCFDVGANVGNRVKIFLKLQAKVVAVEPQEQCVRMLKEVFGKEPLLEIVPMALGEKEGVAEIMINTSDTLSSMSPEWINATQKSGRFSEYVWYKKQQVPVTTLDGLIQRYGTPTFIKIDVEGFEYQVIKGLSQPVSMLSLEFTPEYIESTFNCIDYLQGLGEITLNYSIGESMRFFLDEWIKPDEMKSALSSLSGDDKLFGDVYVRFQQFTK